jgi:hypothetical protein
VRFGSLIRIFARVNQGFVPFLTRDDAQKAASPAGGRDIPIRWHLSCGDFPQFIGLTSSDIYHTLAISEA